MTIQKIIIYQIIFVFAVVIRQHVTNIWTNNELDLVHGELLVRECVFALVILTGVM